MAALSLVAATGMTASPHGEGVAAVLHSLDLPSQPSSAEGSRTHELLDKHQHYNRDTTGYTTTTTTKTTTTATLPPRRLHD